MCLSYSKWCRILLAVRLKVFYCFFLKKKVLHIQKSSPFNWIELFYNLVISFYIILKKMSYNTLWSCHFAFNLGIILNWCKWFSNTILPLFFMPVHLFYHFYLHTKHSTALVWREQRTWCIIIFLKGII